MLLDRLPLELDELELMEPPPLDDPLDDDDDEPLLALAALPEAEPELALSGDESLARRPPLPPLPLAGGRSALPPPRDDESRGIWYIRAFRRR